MIIICKLQFLSDLKLCLDRTSFPRGGHIIYLFILFSNRSTMWFLFPFDLNKCFWLTSGSSVKYNPIRRGMSVIWVYYLFLVYLDHVGETGVFLWLEVLFILTGYFLYCLRDPNPVKIIIHSSYEISHVNNSNVKQNTSFLNISLFVQITTLLSLKKYCNIVMSFLEI